MTIDSGAATAANFDQGGINDPQGEGSVVGFGPRG